MIFTQIFYIRNTTDDECLLQNNFFKNKKWCVCVCVCVHVALVRKYQNFNSQIIKIYVDIYIWNYLFLHLCKFFCSLRYNFFSSFIKQNVCCWTGLILYLDLYSIAISDTKLLVKYIYFVCVCELTNPFFFFIYLGTTNFGSLLQQLHHWTPLTCFTFVLHVRHAI